MKKIIQKFPIAIFMILLVSCEEDEVINSPPSTPANIIVSIENNMNVKIEWDSSSDINNDNILYRVFIAPCFYDTLSISDVIWYCKANEELIIPTNDVIIKETNDNTITVTDLEVFNRYSVSVMAIDNFDNESDISKARIFNTVGSGTVVGDIKIRDQIHISLFENHQIDILEGNLMILGNHPVHPNPDGRKESITDMSVLRGIKEIKGDLIIGEYLDLDFGYLYPYDNFDFGNQDELGFEDIEKIDGNLEIYASNGDPLKALKNLKEVGGQIIIKQTSYTDYCSLSDLITENNFEISENLYNPTFADFQAGDCSN
ncbi:fibronectin type III domain-containing protein [Aquimarina sp. D1M17]|uniref:fibronectin type III domain-containing protein n=1 Tax=Aquimarina acroporae TaxID=2937283 RepID=UPI0020BD80A6|nr:fibronectin type III domain-containing protein [Aquimarina acroporae]MCK8523330.1 fibronectin type III domain-containing protein [Aquimarina acroporae]